MSAVRGEVHPGKVHLKWWADQTFFKALTEKTENKEE
jgi:hypothetical protein